MLILTDIYAAREKDVYNISSYKLMMAIKHKYPDKQVYYVKDFVLTAVAVVSVPADYEAKFTFRNFLQTCKPATPETPYKSKWYLL